MSVSAFDGRKSWIAGFLGLNFRLSFRGLGTRLLKRSTSQLRGPVSEQLGEERLSSHERKRGREAPGGEGRASISRSQFLGGIPEGGNEPGVAFVELSADGLAERVEQGRGRFLQARGAMVRVPSQNRRYAQRLAARPRSPGGGFGFDLPDYVESQPRRCQRSR
jgi:hypothetical protein